MKSKKGTILISLGLLLVAAALGFTLYNVWDEDRAGKSAERLSQQLAALIPEKTPVTDIPTAPDDFSEIEIPDYILNPNMDMPGTEIEGWDLIGILEIPSFGLTLPVISEWTAEGLKAAPCRYDGSAYTDDLILAGLNYQSHFGAIMDLAPGEKVIFTDIDGNVFSYEVAETETLMTGAMDALKDGDWDLTLFTQTYGGNYQVTVRCERTK